MAELARVEQLALPPGRRVIVMSDLHGNLPYFEGLLAQLQFSDDDILILDGDLLEKGPQSLALLRRVMTMSRRGNVHSLCGNCDGWARIFDHRRDGEDHHFLDYVRYKRSGLLWDMCLELGTSPRSNGGSMTPFRRSSPSSPRCPTRSRASTMSSPTQA